MSREALISLAVEFLEGLPRGEQVILVLAIYRYSDFDGNNYWEDENMILTTIMNQGVLGQFPKREDILHLLGIHLEAVKSRYGAEHPTAQEVYNYHCFTS